MKRFLILALYVATTLDLANAAVRDGVTVARRGDTPTQTRVATTARSTSPRPAGNVTTASRSAGSMGVVARGESGTGGVSLGPSTSSRAAKSIGPGRAAASSGVVARSGVTTPVGSRTNSASIVSRAATPQMSMARSATASQTTGISGTRTGAAYEKCKTAYFNCMDQFCQLKNDDYRRCSCSDRVYDLTDARNVILAAGEKLTTFTENLDVVGMTAAQATAMRTASEGEEALTSDNSASKALLQAIMNSIKGEDTKVGGRLEELNSINISFDTSGAFGNMDAGATIATYNGLNLYNAVYPQCRDAVREDCNDASLQRAITAYLMAVEQDCNTVQTAISEKQKTMKAAVREGSAMLDLARVENRKKHNSSDITTCLAEVEAAILSEEVCGPGYRKCLDNGEFIDVSTGSPIAGVTNFAQLEKLLTFVPGVEAADQQLSKIQDNQTFLKNFESRVKKFAQPALDKCTEQAEFVWAQYLDKALLDIYYAQRAKVSEIRQGCFDFVSACYVNGDTALTTAMAEITGDKSIILQPNKITLTSDMCQDYVDSCNGMFDGDIVEEYIKNRNETDKLTACRAVARQCFDNFGGSGFENFYYPYSGLFTGGQALDWFSLYDCAATNSDCNPAPPEGVTRVKVYKSECAKQLAEIQSCQDIIEDVFGGFDVYKNENEIYYTSDGPDVSNRNFYKIRTTGVATEVYNNILSVLNTQCQALQGRFLTRELISKSHAYELTDYCIADFGEKDVNGVALKSFYDSLKTAYGVGKGEDMCPKDYQKSVDTQSWGACLCWENGGRRSQDGQTVKCVPALPVSVAPTTGQEACLSGGKWAYTIADDSTSAAGWCTQELISSDKDQVCAFGTNVGINLGADGVCPVPSDGEWSLDSLPKGWNARQTNQIKTVKEE